MTAARARVAAAATGCVVLSAALGALPALAVERNFAGSVQLDYFLLPAEKSTAAGRNVFDGFTNEVALKLAIDVSERFSANVKLCHGCHGLELPMAYFDYRLADELNIRAGRFSPSFGAFNVRHDPANHPTSDKPLPYDMGRMLGMAAWNLGVLPSPFPDNGVEISGTHWHGDRVQLDYAAYAIIGFKADEGAVDIEWSHSLSRSGNLIDNNGRPAVGGRFAVTYRLDESNDLTAGTSLMWGTYDPLNRVAYTIGGADFTARINRTQLRAEYLLRHQGFEAAPTIVFKTPVPAGIYQTFNKHGWYLEVEQSLNEVVGVLARVDGLYRVGNEPVDNALANRAAIFRYTVGGTLTLMPGWRLKGSAELWSFSNDPPVHQDLATGFHMSVVGTF